MGRHQFLLLVVAVLVTISALANLLGTYMIKPIINRYVVPGDLQGLVFGVGVTALIYAAGALSALGDTQKHIYPSQKLVYGITRCNK